MGAMATGSGVGQPERPCGVFIVEAALKMLALWPRTWQDYFRDGWNIFDFAVIVFALVPATGQFAMIARLARLLRVVRLISAIRDLRLIVAALVRAIPSGGPRDHADERRGVHLRHHGLPPVPRPSIRRAGAASRLSLLTLFNIITLDGWTAGDGHAAMRKHYPCAWLYFVSFVVVGTFVVINMFIAIIINSLDDAKRERDRDRPAEIEGPVSREQMVREIRAARDTLERLERRLEAEENDGRGK